MDFLEKIHSLAETSDRMPYTPQQMFFRTAAGLLFCFSGGVLYAASLPPFNLSLLAAVCLLPLLGFMRRADLKKAALSGWIWGLGWSLFSFRFLREIDPAVPWLIAPVLSLWPAFFAMSVSTLTRNTLKKDGMLPAKEQPFAVILLISTGTAAFFVLTEWTRSRLFTWNDFSVPFWRIPAMLQISTLTGHYGVNFTVALCNTALAALLFYRSRKVFAVLFAVIIAVYGYGFLKLHCRPEQKTLRFSPALIQGNLSQRRHASMEQVKEALDVYVSTTAELLEKSKPEIVIWPESAIPIPFYSAHDLSRYYQSSDYGRFAGSYQLMVKGLCRRYSTPMLIGALDLEDSLDGKGGGATNSALLFDSSGSLKAKYDKLHRVPFGEYIPFRRLLPEFVLQRIDMGRDLVPGRNANPVVLSPDIRSGTAICYEGVFSYVMRNFAKRGANVFIVLSNDAWYPRSSEPEQHLANAVLRAVETGLPMIRCGNNGGSGMVYPDGTFRIIDPTGKHPRPELLRCKAAEVISVDVPLKPEQTFYVRYGEWFILLLILQVLFWAKTAAGNFLADRKRTADLLEKE